MNPSHYDSKDPRALERRELMKIAKLPEDIYLLIIEIMEMGEAYPNYRLPTTYPFFTKLHGPLHLILQSFCLGLSYSEMRHILISIIEEHLDAATASYKIMQTHIKR